MIYLVGSRQYTVFLKDLVSVGQSEQVAFNGNKRCVSVVFAWLPCLHAYLPGG
jgi:hypothetical protein